MEPGRVLSAGRSAGRRVLTLPPSAGALRALLSAPWSASAWADEQHVGDGTALVDAAVLVGIVTGPDPGVLLTRRTDTLRRHAGQVSFPGGRIDPGDASPEDAALREAWEEIGLPAGAAEICGRLQAYVTATGYRIIPVVALIAPGYATTLSAMEVAAVFELPLSVLLDPAAPARRRTVVMGAAREYWVWPHHEHDIWGATAAILVHLADRLRPGLDGLRLASKL